MDELKVYFGILQAAGTRHDRRLVGRLANRVGGLRKKATKELVGECLSVYAGGCPELNQIFNVQPPPQAATTTQPTEQAFGWLLALKYLQDTQTLSIETSRAVINRILGFNERELDSLLARCVQAHVHTASRQHKPADIHGDLMRVLRVSRLRHDRETVTAAHNGLARVYLTTGQWEMMERLFTAAPFPLEQSTHNQAARHHYYSARLSAVKLQYEGAYGSVEQALRKAPNHAASFKAVCHRLLVVVRLLLGDVPELALLRDQTSTGAIPACYYQLCKTVRNGDLAAFQHLLLPESPSLSVFQRDNLEGLILRLHQNVVKAGLKRIACAYSAISVADIQAKLSLDTPQDATMMVMKGVCDGVIQGRLCGAGVEAVLTVAPDTKTDAEKAAHLHTRILHCHSLTQEAVRSMRFPDRKPAADRSTMEQSIAEPDLDDMAMMEEDFF